jgi:hypothetical protein
MRTACAATSARLAASWDQVAHFPHQSQTLLACSAARPAHPLSVVQLLLVHPRSQPQAWPRELEAVHQQRQQVLVMVGMLPLWRYLQQVPGVLILQQRARPPQAGLAMVAGVHHRWLLPAEIPTYGHTAAAAGA